MRKYYYIFKANIMSNLQYIFNIMISFINYFILIFIYLNVWQYIYSDPSKLIYHYSVQQMVWYVIITEMLWFATSGRILCQSISNDVRSGNIAYNMNKPYSYIGYVLANHLGEILVSGLLYGTAGLIMGLILLGGVPTLSLAYIPFILIVIIFSVIINTMLITVVGLISFWIEDSSPFYWLYSKLLLVFGVFFPIEFFPKYLQGFLQYSPVYVIIYGPAKLFVDFSYINLFKIISVQTIYLVVAYLGCQYMYERGVRKLNVNGG